MTYKQLTAEQLENEVERTRKELLSVFGELAAREKRRCTKIFEELERLQLQLAFRKFYDRQRAEARWMHGEY